MGQSLLDLAVSKSIELFWGKKELQEGEAFIDIMAADQVVGELGIGTPEIAALFVRLSPVMPTIESDLTGRGTWAEFFSELVAEIVLGEMHRVDGNVLGESRRRSGVHD